ncbi:hypothetical protein [Spirosoma linguale]|uniref:Uncharacterized protein n=1 Tax=Spirosoma linguale (strain ATCC 33905 / DSM 74 / LMG 10896 / Claus 1) TaxID=504472 RepID=D2QT43_SPILD|nr:hypothetical protein Slin_6013 [Spirosoma linguale DSM 74]
MKTDSINKEKPTAKKLGRYATAEEAVKIKNTPLVALLKKLNVKVAPGS